MASQLGLTAPSRGTRPANRRQLIIDATAALLYRDGYPHVAMTDIADAVAVRASALYRHFPGKQDLLAEVLLARAGSLRQALADGADPATAALAHRDLGVLLLREARHLEPERRGALERGVVALSDELAASMGHPWTGAGAEFRTWCVLAVLLSPSFHQVQLPGDGLAGLVRELGTAVSGLQLPAGAGDRPTQAGLHPLTARSRREQILAAAIGLFAERGYQAVGIEDIGAAAGIAGTSIYRHFATKADVLLAAMNRGAEWLRLDLTRTLAQANDAADGLRGLLRSYVTFVLDESELIDVMLSETSHLPDTERDRIRQTQRDYVNEWVHLAAEAYPAGGRDAARVRVQAALTVANTVSRNPRLRAEAGVEDALEAVGAVLLALP